MRVFTFNSTYLILYHKLRLFRKSYVTGFLTNCPLKKVKLFIHRKTEGNKEKVYAYSLIKLTLSGYIEFRQPRFLHTKPTI